MVIWLLAKVLTEMSPEDVIEVMKQSGFAWQRRRRVPHPSEMASLRVRSPSEICVMLFVMQMKVTLVRL